MIRLYFDVKKRNSPNRKASATRRWSTESLDWRPPVHIDRQKMDSQEMKRGRTRGEDQIIGEMPDSGTLAKRSVIFLLFGAALIIFAARFFVPLHYAFAMPRTPDPTNGRIYRAMVGGGIHVYLNKRELHVLDFLDYDLTAIAVGCMFALIYLKLRLKWF